MMSSEDPPGFKRVENVGSRPFYLTVPQIPGEIPRKLTNITEVADYLRKQNLKGHYTGVKTTHFDFCKKMAKRKSYEDVTISHEKVMKLSDIFKDDCALGESSGKSKHDNPKC